MATQPTNLSVPSESPRDLKFNAGKIDEFVTSLVNTYVDRFGNEHYTIEGLKQLVLKQIYSPDGTLKDLSKVAGWLRIPAICFRTHLRTFGIDGMTLPHSLKQYHQNPLRLLLEAPELVSGNQWILLTCYERI